MYALKFLLFQLDQHRSRFVLAIIMGILTGVAGFLIPFTLAEFTKQSFSGDTVVRLVLIVSGLYVSSLATAYYVRGRGEAFAFGFSQHLRMKYFRRLVAMSPLSLQKVHSGFSMSQVNKIADGYTDVLFSLMWHIAPGLVVAVLFLYFIARESLGLAAFNIAIIALFLALSFVLSRKMVPLIRESNTRRSRLLASYVDFMANITTVKKLGLQRYTGKELSARSRSANAQIDAVQHFHARRWFFQHALFGVAYLSTVGFLIYQIGLGTVSASLLILFIAAYGTLRSLIEQLSEIVKSLMEMRVYIEQLEEILEGEALYTAGVTKPEWEYIQFRDVVFRYDDGVSVRIPRFDLPKGNVVVLTGRSGQGKSTFINLFMNGLTPTSGQRNLSAYEYSHLGSRFFEDSVALVAQDIELFNISLRENILLGKDMDDETLWSHLDELQLKPWAEELEHGLDTIIGEKGAKLSAGQKQRISILRAIVFDRPILVLDEPTSNLDSHTEEIVIAFIRKHSRGKTILIVTHRPALLALADEVYEMANHTLTKV